MITYAYRNLYEREMQYKIIFWSGIAVAIFLNVFQPFGINNGGFSLKGIMMVSGYGLITSIGLSVMIIFGKVFRKLYAVHPIVFCTISLAFITSLVFLYFKVVFSNVGNTDSFIELFLNTIIVGVFILLIFKGIFGNNQINEHHLFNGNITIQSNNKSETGIQLIPSKLVMIEAHGNYIMIYYLHRNEIKTKLIRNTMKEASKRCIQFPGMVRCHVSFIINSDHVIELINNKNSHCIILNYLEKSIPCSSKHYSSLKSLIG